MINTVGTTLGSHCGPGMVALFFYGTERGRLAGWQFSNINIIAEHRRIAKPENGGSPPVGCIRT